MKHAPVIFVVIALTLAGCGGGGSGESGNEATLVPDGISVLAGVPGGGGSVFSVPQSVALDTAGNIFVADTGNHAIKKISPAGVVTTVAGKPGTWGSADGVGVAARFYSPQGVAVDGAGNVYVSDSANATLRKIASDGMVTTLAGTAGVEGPDNGPVDGVGSAALFSVPGAIALDPAGNLLVIDDRTIRKVSPSGMVTTFAGRRGVGGSTNGPGAAARFATPSALAVDAAGRIYVADRDNQIIRVITPGGVVSTFAGTVGVNGEVNGAVATALFDYPTAIAVDATGNVYVGDTGEYSQSSSADNAIRKITSAGEVTTLAGAAGWGSRDGVGAAASFDFVGGLAVDAAGNVFAADTLNNAVRRITSAGVVTTLAGTAPPMFDATYTCASADGVAANAKFCRPSALAVDQHKNIYVADTGNNTIRKITYGGGVSTLAGKAGVAGFQDGIGTAAAFGAPSGIAVDANGVVYVSDSANHLIRKISPAGVVSTLAGADWEDGVPGFGGRPRSYPTALAVDNAGTVYAVDRGIGTVRKISAAGVVTTPPGLSPAGTPLCGIALDAAGNLYLTSVTTVFVVTPNGGVTTLAGSQNVFNAVDGVGEQAAFSFACDLALDAGGAILVVDQGNNTIRRVAHDGTVTTIVGQGGSGPLALGALPGALDTPSGLAIDGNGVLYTASENAVLRIKLPSP